MPAAADEDRRQPPPADGLGYCWSSLPSTLPYRSALADLQESGFADWCKSSGILQQGNAEGVLEAWYVPVAYAARMGSAVERGPRYPFSDLPRKGSFNVLDRLFRRLFRHNVELAAVVIQYAEASAKRNFHFDPPQHAGCGVVNLTISGRALVSLEGVVDAVQSAGDYYLLYGPGLTDFRHAAWSFNGRLSITFRYVSPTDGG